MSGIERRASFDLIRYGSCWEDASVLLAGLGGTVLHGNVLSIGAAGDNVLALLTGDPDRVVAMDLSLPQLACLELRMAAFRTLEWEETLEFLGVRPSPVRWQMYAGLRRSLGSWSRGFWDRHRSEIEHGAVRSGKFERYLGVFRRWCLPLVHRRATIDSLLTPKPREERRSFYAERWDSRSWRALFHMFFGRAVMARLGRDPAFFEHVDGPTAGPILERARHAVTELDPATNPYLRFILTGTYGCALPVYLEAANYAAIRDRLDRIELVHGRIACPPPRFGAFSAFNLSDVFEYMSPSEFAEAASLFAKRAAPGARVAYWNMRVPRRLSEAALELYCPDRVRAERLHAADRAFFYRAFHVDQIRGDRP